MMKPWFLSRSPGTQLRLNDVLLETMLMLEGGTERRQERGKVIDKVGIVFESSVKNACNFTSFQQGGAPPLDGRSISGGGACDHFEVVMAAGVQRGQLNVSHIGVTDHLHLQRAVSALHLYTGNTQQGVQVHEPSSVLKLHLKKCEPKIIKVS